MADTGSDGGLRNTLYRRLTRSGRRMTAARRLLYAIVVPVGLAIIRLWWASCRIVRVEGAEHLKAALDKAPSFVPCFWHQHQGFCAKYLLDERMRGFAVGWLISPSVDGEIGVMLVRRVGGSVIRGSSSHTGARALRDYYLALVQENISPVITPDGPRGPRFKFKPGAILLAQMSGRPMLPMAYAASRASLIKWDKFVLPWPGSRIVMAIGPPRYVPRVLDAAHIERLQREMEAELMRLYCLARDALKTVSSGH
ncbi:MAG TPA: lysophospholipid acyltransferase family protein [Steroidobacteraceae bacterium]